MNPLIRAAALLHFIDLVAELHADPHQILREVGLSANEISDPDALISASAFINALQLASEKTNRDDFGLQLGIRQDINMLGPIGLLARQCSTAKEAINVISRYMNLHNPGAALELQSASNKSLLCYDDITGGHPRNPQLCDLALALAKQVIDLFVQKPWRADAVFFIHKEPTNKKQYQQHFNAPLHFNQEIYALKVDSNLLDIEVHHSDGKLKDFFQNYVDNLEKIHKENTVSVVEHLIRSLLNSGYCNEQHIASILEITPRTLQRRLKQHNTTFKALLNNIRLKLAEQYLLKSNMPFTEISHSLGYSELSAFTRFFKRETGLSPSNYKRLHNPIT